MLVLSGVFVLLAMVALVAGLVTETVGQVYLSIGASLVAAALLARGVYQRRPARGADEPESPVG